MFQKHHCRLTSYSTRVILTFSSLRNGKSSWHVHCSRLHYIHVVGYLSNLLPHVSHSPTSWMILSKALLHVLPWWEGQPVYDPNKTQRDFHRSKFNWMDLLAFLKWFLVYPPTSLLPQPSPVIPGEIKLSGVTIESKSLGQMTHCVTKTYITHMQPVHMMHTCNLPTHLYVCPI